MDIGKEKKNSTQYCTVKLQTLYCNSVMDKQEVIEGITVINNNWQLNCAKHLCQDVNVWSSNRS